MQTAAAAACIQWNGGKKTIQILYTVANRNQVLMRTASRFSSGISIWLTAERKQCFFFFLRDEIETGRFSGYFTFFYFSFGSGSRLSTLGSRLSATRSTPIKFYYVTNYYLTASISSSTIHTQMQWEWNVTQTTTDNDAFDHWTSGKCFQKLMILINEVGTSSLTIRNLNHLLKR